MGRALLPELNKANHDVAVLVRSGGAGPKEISWNADTGEVDRQKLEQWGGPECVVHLAGEGIADQGVDAGRRKKFETAG